MPKWHQTPVYPKNNRAKARRMGEMSGDSFAYVPWSMPKTGAKFRSHQTVDCNPLSVCRERRRPRLTRGCPVCGRNFWLFSAYLLADNTRKNPPTFGLQQLLRINTTEKIQEKGDRAGPTCLVAGAEAGAVVTM